MRGSESGESQHESSSPLSRPLFKGIWASAPEEEPGTTVRYRWRRWGPGAVGPGSADLWGRPAPGWAPWCPPLARCFLNGYELWKYCARPNVCSKRCPNYFSQRILKLRKYFWSFCKKGKMLEKFQHAENNFENFKHAVEKNK